MIERKSCQQFQRAASHKGRMNILGISCLYHDSAAALLRDGQIIAAAQEERFTRIKHDRNVPEYAIRYCLREGGITKEEIDYIVYYDKPFLTLDRYIKNIFAVASEAEDGLNELKNKGAGDGLDEPKRKGAEDGSDELKKVSGDDSTLEENVFQNMCDSVLGEKLWIHEKIKCSIGSLGRHGKLMVCGHHMSHAASAFYASPYNDAVIITNDGVGEWATTTIGAQL